MNKPIDTDLLQYANSTEHLTRETVGDRHQRIYKTIRERISLLYYPPNTVIGETELAGEFNVSRTPIRRVFAAFAFRGISRYTKWRWNSSYGH